MLLTKPLFRCPGRCVWDHCHAEKPSQRCIFNALLMEGGFHSKSHDTWPHSFFLYTDQSSWSLWQKNSPKAWCFHPLLHSRYGGSFGCNSAFFLLQTRQVEFLTKSYNFYHPKCSLANFRRAWTCTGLSRGTGPGTAGLESLAAQCVTDGSLCYLLGPQLSAGHSLGPPRVVLGFCSQFLWSFWPPRGEILNGAPDRGRLSVVLVCLPFFK